MKTTLEQGRVNAEMCGSRYDAAYCECLIAGVPHTVDLTLVPGYSSLHHMADVPMAAAIEAIGGKDYPTIAAAKKAATAAMIASLRGRPTIRLVFRTGALASRWRAQNEDEAIRLVRLALPSHMARSVASVDFNGWHKARDGRQTANYALTESGSTWGYIRMWADSMSEPDADFEVGEIRCCL